MPGKVVKEVLKLLEKKVPEFKDITVSDVRIGLGYTGVKLSTGHVGVCHTLSHELICYQRNEGAGTLSGSSALEIAELAHSWKLPEAVIAIATINALSQIIFQTAPGDYSQREENCINQIEIKKDDTVTMVGYIKPFVSNIRSRAKKLYIMERNLKSKQDEEILPDVACEEIIPRADVIIITGTAIANGTIDHLLTLSGSAREVAVVGPTASMIPDPLFQEGVTVMGGIKVTNAERLLQVISEGGGVQQFKDACSQIVIRPKRIP